ncbi:hypothetical protein [Metabacillus fastidiosus]|uniref:hypothetical protein n=1 Tax=Metabacillus fastidiosus TaxID=1458 RepID=UPI003D268155
MNFTDNEKSMILKKALDIRKSVHDHLQDLSQPTQLLINKGIFLLEIKKDL